jgi:urease accessory protein
MIKLSHGGAASGGALRLLFPAAPLLLLALSPGPALAHHVMELFHWQPTPFNGLASGLFHPLLGPDHLLFLLALSLVGLRHRSRWMLGLLGVGLLGSWAGLVLPGLPGAESLVALSLAVVALVLLGRLPRALLLPAFALHGYVLSASVLGWSPMPVLAYLLGLALSQGLLLYASLQLLARFAAALSVRSQRRLALALAAAGTLLACAPLLA